MALTLSIISYQRLPESKDIALVSKNNSKYFGRSKSDTCILVIAKTSNLFKSMKMKFCAFYDVYTGTVL